MCLCQEFVILAAVQHSSRPGLGSRCSPPLGQNKTHTSGYNGKLSLKLQKENKPQAFHSYTAGGGVHFLRTWAQLPSRMAVFAGCLTPWGCLEGCPGSWVRKQLYELATTTVSTSAAPIPLNSISQSLNSYSSRKRIKKVGGVVGGREKSNVLLKPLKPRCL